MKRVLKYCTPLVLMAAVTVSCNKESSPGVGENNITFSVAMAEEETKAGQYTGGDLSGLDEFKVTGYQNSEPSPVINNGTVKKHSSVWLLEGDSVAWPEETTMTFWASANLPAWASVSSTSSASATLKITAVPTNAADQWDPLVGYYSGPGDAGNAKITFYHPMTAVKFKKIGTAVDCIESVKLIGLYEKGTVNVTVSSTIPSYDWQSTRTGSISASGSFVADSSATPFLLIPQNLSSVNVSMEINLMLSGVKKTMFAKLDSGEWVAGYIYTYTLDYSPAMDNLTVTLSNWEKITRTKNGKTVDYFDSNFDE